MLSLMFCVQSCAPCPRSTVLSKKGGEVLLPYLQCATPQQHGDMKGRSSSAISQGSSPTKQPAIACQQPAYRI